MAGMKMYVEIQKLKKLGYKKQRAARQLGLDTKTVRKYWDMGEDEYVWSCPRALYQAQSQ